jgi:hypothetical protein
MRVFEMVIADENEHGVSVISLVENPAIDEHWVALNKHDELKLQLADVEKRILYGAALVPDRAIRRVENGNEFFITFSAETIEKAAHKFMREMRLTATNHEHDAELKGNVIVESWITAGENDKAAALGLNPPAGTWMIAMSVGSDKYWQEQVKTGNVKGFSIEGVFVDAMRAAADTQPRSVEDELLSELKAVLLK